MMIQSLAHQLGGSLVLIGIALPLGDIFVDKNAPNCVAGTGTAVDPVCSIEAAVDLAAPGDTIHIAAGIYLENVEIDKDLSLVGTSGSQSTTIDAMHMGTVVEVLTNSTVSLDGLTIRGGGKSGIIARGDFTLRNSLVTANRAKYDYYSEGGGILAITAPGSVTIEYSSIIGNFADCYEVCQGAGIFVDGVDLTILSSTISENNATHFYVNGASNGGGIYASDSQITIANTTISHNAVMLGTGGGLACINGGLTMTNSTVSNNETFLWGGGIALYNPSVGSQISNSTITENRGSGGALMDISTGPDLQIRNSIVAGNGPFPSPPNPPADVLGTFDSLGNNLIGSGGSWVTNGVNGDVAGTRSDPALPVLASLQDNGGPTKTHRLLLGSPALDAGNPLVFLPQDQRGLARPIGAAPDMGAVEFTPGDISFCNGDGGDQQGCTNCPCSNNAVPGSIGGCLNSASTPTQLLATGEPSVSLPSMSIRDLRFALTGAPVGALCVLTSGDAVATSNPLNPCFGQQSGVQFSGFDGLRCAITNFKRHGSRTADMNGEVGTTNAPWGGEGGPPVGIANQARGFATGQTRYFQMIHRDDPLAMCMTGLNTSQAIEIRFMP